MLIQVDYSIDKQWNVWVKVGIRKLVSLDGITNTMTEYESAIVNQDSATAATMSPGPGHHPAVGVVYTSNKLINLLPLSVSGDDACDTELNQSGSDLLDDIGWGFSGHNEEATNTPVSQW